MSLANFFAIHVLCALILSPHLSDHQLEAALNALAKAQMPFGNSSVKRSYFIVNSTVNRILCLRESINEAWNASLADADASDLVASIADPEQKSADIAALPAAAVPRTGPRIKNVSARLPGEPKRPRVDLLRKYGGLEDSLRVYEQSLRQSIQDPMPYPSHMGLGDIGLRIGSGCDRSPANFFVKV